MTDATRCEAPGCDRTARVKGLCGKHYERVRVAGGDRSVLERPGKQKLPENDGPCSIEGCDEPAKTRGMCQRHYTRVWRTGSAGGPELKRRPRAGRICEVPGCQGPVRAQEMCQSHYMLKWRYGTLDVKKGWEFRDEVCSVEGCEREHKSSGFCQSHYARWRRNGDPGPAEIGTKQPREGTCQGPECSDPVHSSGLCTGHYEQQRQGYELTPKRVYAKKGVPCLVEICDREAEVEGMCDTHRRRWRRGEPDWDAPIAEKAPNGSGHLNTQGYRVITIDGIRHIEHRLIVERLLGRSLHENENIHHRNGDRADNRVAGPFKMNDRGHLVSGNLEIWSKAQPAGQEIGPKLDYALDILRQYLPQLDDARAKDLRALVEDAPRREVTT